MINQEHVARFVTHYPANLAILNPISVHFHSCNQTVTRSPKKKTPAAMGVKQFWLIAGVPIAFKDPAIVT